MRVAAYVHPHRTLYRTTGVGKHMVNLVDGLSREPGFDLRLLASRSTLNDGKYPSDSRLRDFPLTVLPIRRDILEWCWTLLHRPRVDRWCPNQDWIYCPIETFVPTKTARLGVTIHDVEPLETHLPWSQSKWARRRRRNWHMRLRPICKYANIIFTVSEFTAERLNALLGIRRDRIVVVGNGVEDNFFETAPTPPPDPRISGRPYVLMVGGLDQRKGADIVFETARQLQRLGSDIVIAIAGFMSDELKAQAAAISNIRTLGFVDTDDLPHWLRRSLAMFLPSRYEGFGIPIVEAMAAGTPAVVSRSTALPEVGGEAVYYVDIANPKSIAEQLIVLAQDDTMRQQLITKGRQRAEQFRWNICVQRLVSALRDFK